MLLQDGYSFTAYVFLQCQDDGPVGGGRTAPAGRPRPPSIAVYGTDWWKDYTRTQQIWPPKSSSRSASIKMALLPPRGEKRTGGGRKMPKMPRSLFVPPMNEEQEEEEEEARDSFGREE